MKEKIILWIRAVRAPFYTATLISGILGGILAWYDTNNFIWSYFLLTLLGIIFVQTGTNLSNDYFDHTSNLDEINETPTPFSGGSRVIQDKLIQPKKIFLASIISFGLAAIIGLYLNYKTPGNVILYIGIIGIFFAYFYTASPLRLGYYSLLGELIAGISCGPLIVVGTYYVQVRTLSWKPILASIPLGILVSLILYINEFPDYAADKKIGKKNIVILLGKQKAIKLFFMILGMVYLLIIAGVIIKLFSFFALITLITFPIYLNIIKIGRANYNTINELLPVNAATIKLHLIIGCLISISYVLDKLIYS